MVFCQLLDIGGVKCISEENLNSEINILILNYIVYCIVYYSYSIYNNFAGELNSLYIGFCTSCYFFTF
jgi:hypothetical protein